MTNNEYMRGYRASRRRALIAMMGGSCVVCGSEDNLEFDHIKPSDKSFSISRYYGSLENIEAELKKCQLLCKQCHLETTRSEVRSGSHCRQGHKFSVRNGRNFCKECDKIRKIKWREKRRQLGLKVT